MYQDELEEHDKTYVSAHLAILRRQNGAALEFLIELDNDHEEKSDYYKIPWNTFSKLYQVINDLRYTPPSEPPVNEGQEWIRTGFSRKMRALKDESMAAMNTLGKYGRVKKRKAEDMTEGPAEEEEEEEEIEEPTREKEVVLKSDDTKDQGVYMPTELEMEEIDRPTPPSPNRLRLTAVETEALLDAIKKTSTEGKGTGCKLSDIKEHMPLWTQYKLKRGLEDLIGKSIVYKSGPTTYVLTDNR
jgi:hypothetical protein